MPNELKPEEVEFLFDLQDEDEQAEAAPRAVTFKRLFDYANRSPSAPLDFEIERKLRENWRLLRSYTSLLSDQAIAFCEMAAAASSDDYPLRQLGFYCLSVVEDGGDYFIELSFDDADRDLMARDAASNPQVIEFCSDDGLILMYELGPVVKGVRMIILDAENEKDQQLLDLLKSPSLGIFLKSGHDED